MGADARRYSFRDFDFGSNFGAKNQNLPQTLFKIQILKSAYSFFVSWVMWTQGFFKILEKVVCVPVDSKFTESTTCEFWMCLYIFSITFRLNNVTYNKAVIKNWFAKKIFVIQQETNNTFFTPELKLVLARVWLFCQICLQTTSRSG